MRATTLPRDPDRPSRSRRSRRLVGAALIVSAAALPAAAQSQVWIRQLGTNKLDVPFAVAVDGLQRVYTGGWTEGSLGGSNVGNEDAWLSCHDAGGNLLWSRQVGTTWSDVVRTIATGTSSGVYAGGYQDADLFSPVSWDGWLSRYDTAGNLAWTRQLAGTGWETVEGLAPDGAGGVFAGGYTTGQIGAASVGLLDAFLARYDSFGTQQWLIQFGTPVEDLCLGAAHDGVGGVYLVGVTGGSFGGTLAGVYDAWLARFDGGGNELWRRQLGTNLVDQALAVSGDGAGGVYLCGRTDGSLFAPKAGGEDAWLARFDSAGHRLWAHQLGSSADDHASGIASDGAGGCFVGGPTRGALAGPIQASTAGWYAHYDAAGSQDWIAPIGGDVGATIEALAADGLGGFVLTGATSGGLAGPNAGGADAWVAHHEGTCSTGSSYCTASSTSIPGCQASIHGVGSPSLSAPGGFAISSGNVPGGALGICLYGNHGPASTPLGTLGGQLCVQAPFVRSAPHPSGGSAGQCDGQLDFTLQDLAAASPIVAVGAALHAQIWARDAANPDGFLLTDGLRFWVCP